ncbi:sacsin N-terminal ATP-binding-like domain-containing protein [Amycolatopsis roodepoortensis]|uniref:Protein NO VEIN C-terminal domain-containing protein n=1 Tax=Amycolatopsis roodepoortensis TaxID=700274 RepID=A0ABR9LB61_9PSEU|nr:DUF3883 domain-containing protein [Amycolatopsis roodepoortensis]MBE1577667.1 hypothetical protein [Amycolatopsis roodepoortensis]
MAALGSDLHDSASAPRDRIVAYAAKVFAEFAATDLWDPGAQLRAASAHAGNEYAGRFLLELLQNAHDTHPADRHDGRITIVVDANEGAHGVVYVANFGTPFTYESMNGLCKLACSPKEIGQGIGHKGIGFRSILPVCTRPEIYSADPAGPPGNLDGYTFRFADLADLLTLARGDETLARRADEKFPPFQLPVPIDTIPAAVRELAAAGHVTIVRLPLDTPDARREALTQATNLVASDVPTLLFLERIGALTIVRHDGGDSAETSLTRTQQPFSTVTTPDLSFTQVALGELGDYTVASTSVPATRLREAVQNARHGNRLSAAWDTWDEAVVSLAVPTDGEVTGRMFTFLPMGDEASSPFAGHLNAPFFTKIDRADLDPNHPLNNLLLDVAAETALTAAAALQPSGLAAARRWISDLVCWDDPHTERLAQAADRSGDGPLAERQFVPIEAAAEHPLGWASLADTYRWPGQNPTVLTAARAAESGICLVDSGLGEDRADRWEAFADWLDHPLDPDTDTLVELIERIAATLERPSAYDDTIGTLRARPAKGRAGKAAKKSARARRQSGEASLAALWAGVYSDLADIFPAYGATVLRGRTLLVDDAGDLRPTNTPPPAPSERGSTRRVTAFLPPARDDTPIAVPASLRKDLFYLHPAIAEQLGSAGRALLLNAGLVDRYDIRSLLDHVGTILVRTKSERIHRDALRFVFSLEQNGQIPPRYPLRQLRLHVPSTVGKMVPANRAAFGSGWDGHDYTDLITVIEDAREVDSGFAELAYSLVEPVSDLVRPTDDRTAWSRFLSKIGISSGLDLRTTSAATPKLVGSTLSGPTFATRLRVREPIAEQWVAHLSDLPPRRIAFPQTEYVADRKPRWAMGQAIAEKLTDPAREAYARLFLNGLASWHADRLHMNWDRDRRGIKDRQTVPTPLAAFMTTAAWLPAAPKPGRPLFARPDQLWHFSLSSNDAEPAFAPLASRATRLFLDKNPQVLTALKNAGLGDWSDPAHAVRLVRSLGAAAAAGSIGEDQRDQFSRAYLRAWSTVVKRPTSSLVGMEDLHLVLREGERLSVRTAAELTLDDVTVYLASPGDGLHLRLLDELELPVLFVDADLEGAQAVLTGVLGDSVQIADETSVTVAPTGGTGQDELLLERLPWMAVLVAAAANHGHGLTLQERDFDDLARGLRRLRIETYTDLGLSLFDQPTELPATSYGLFADPDYTYPVILSPTSVSDLRGPALVALAEEIAVAIDFPSLRERLRAAVLSLQLGGNEQPDPSDADLAHALRLTNAQVEATRIRLDGGLEAVIERLYPVLVHWSGQAAADAAVDNARATTDLAELSAALLKLASSLPVQPGKLIEAARTATSIDELRISLDIEFSAFNTTLAGLSPAYTPISYQAAHEQALRQHLALYHQELCDQVRWVRLANFDAYRPQSDWPDLRSFTWVTVPETWGTTVDKPKRADLTALVANAAETRLGQTLPTSGPSLPTLSAVTAANKALVTHSAPGIARLARAWASSHRATLVEALSSSDPGTEILTLFDNNGVLDFRRLGENDIPTWLKALGAWPAGMPVTTDPRVAGVTPEELAAADSAATIARQERERQRRLIHIDGNSIDVGVGATNIAALVDALQASLEAHPSVISASNRVKDLQPMSALQPRRSGGAAKVSRDPMAGLSDEQRQALGFAGEWLAYQWLTRIYPETNESSWVSTNRAKVFTGNPGDDSLGFDFQVERPNGAIMFEVKASRADPGMFTLTDSEIREARRHARNGRWRLLIVPYVSDPARCRVLRLPNPFEARAEGLFRAEGDGIRYRYHLDQ